MIGLGMDLCQVSRIEQALEKGDGFLRRCYTQEEQAYLQSRGQLKAQSAAALFAAKEALFKALGVGLGQGVSFQEVGVVHLPGGAPCYRLTGAAAERLAALGGTRAYVSLTHEGGMAGAVAVIE